MRQTHPVTVEVDTETGRVAVVEFDYDHQADSYVLCIAGELMDQAPEAVAAGAQMAVLSIALLRAGLAAAARHQTA